MLSNLVYPYVIATLPKPFAPTAPAIAEYPIIDIIESVIPDIIDGMASFTTTLNIICILDAPKDLAASISPLSTSLSADSIILAINGADAIVSGTIAAVSPILVPTINLVKGIIATINIIKGKLLKVLTINPKIELIILLGFNPHHSTILGIVKPIILSYP